MKPRRQRDHFVLKISPDAICDHSDPCNEERVERNKVGNEKIPPAGEL